MGSDEGRTASDEAAKVARSLACWLAAELPGAGDIRIEGLQRRSSGLSRENWVFDASWVEDGRRHREPLIARRDPPGSVLVTDRRAEFELLVELAATDVPAPGVRWLDPDGRWLGRPTIVMQRVEGVCDYFVLNGTLPLEDRLDLARQFCDLLIAIHGVDWRAGGLDRLSPDPGPAAAVAALDHWEGELRRCQLESLPEVDFVFNWLRANAPASRRTVLVHGDFKPGNALLVDGRVSAVLDWETAHLGDPVEDLGWVTNPVRRREHQIPGHWEVDELLARYNAATGLDVGPAELPWWNVFSNLKLLIISLTGQAAYVQGRYDRALQFPGSLLRVMFDQMGV